jgi:hypothetical protein
MSICYNGAQCHVILTIVSRYFHNLVKTLSKIPVYGGSRGVVPLTLDLITGWIEDLPLAKGTPVPVK